MFSDSRFVSFPSLILFLRSVFVVLVLVLVRVLSALAVMDEMYIIYCYCSFSGALFEVWSLNVQVVQVVYYTCGFGDTML